LKNQLNLSQLRFLSSNGQNPTLSMHFDFQVASVMFITHLQEFFFSSKIHLTISQPFLSSEFQQDNQSVTLFLDQLELGELVLVSYPNYSASLTYHSPTGLLKTTILDAVTFPSLYVNDYLALLQEFASHLLGEKAFYHLLGEE